MDTINGSDAVAIKFVTPAKAGGSIEAITRTLRVKPYPNTKMKKLTLILAVAAFAFSPLFVSSAQAGSAKGHKSHHAKHHYAKHHHAKHHKVA